MDVDIELSKDLGRWLGLLITDGTINKRGRFLTFSNKEKFLVDDFCEITKNIFDLEGKLVRIQKNDVQEIQINSSKLVKILNTKFNVPIGNKSGIIQVPNGIINNTKNEIIRSFIQGVFDGDGSVVVPNKKHRIKRVDLTSKSGQFLIQVKSLLEKFQISSRLAKKESRLLITRIDDIRKFQRFIDFKHPRRHAKLMMLVN